MKLVKSILLSSILFSGLASAKTEVPVTLSGAFYATSGHSMGLEGEKSAFIYSVYGASNLEQKNGKKIRVSIECLGFDELGNSEGTHGEGRCTWIDESNDKLFLSVATVGDGNQYKILGGTGKWLKASGIIKTKFVYLPTSSDKFFLGTDDGSGTIIAPNFN